MNNPATRLVMYIPGLLDADWHQQVMTHHPCRAVQLQRMLTRADVTEQGPGSLLSHRHLVWGEAAAGEEIPFATFRFSSGEESDRQRRGAYLMCADPVYLQADRDQAVLVAHEELQLEPHETQQLLETLNQHFGEDGLYFQAGGNQHWYVHHEHADTQTTPLRDVKGQAIREHLPRGESGKSWWRWLNEIQMILHQHPVNQQREAEGLLPVNSVWFWGNSDEVQTGGYPWSVMITDNHLDRCFAHYHGIACQHHEDDLQLSANTLYIDESLLMARYALDSDEWCRALHTIESGIVQKGIDLLKKGSLHSIEVMPGNDRCYRFTRQSMKRWWKSSRSLKQLAEAGA